MHAWKCAPLGVCVAQDPSKVFGILYLTGRNLQDNTIQQLLGSPPGGHTLVFKCLSLIVFSKLNFYCFISHIYNQLCEVGVWFQFYRWRDSGLPGGSVVKNLPANAGVAGLIPRSGRSGEDTATHPSIFPWQIPWMEESGELQSMGSKRSWTQLSD